MPISDFAPPDDNIYQPVGAGIDGESQLVQVRDNDAGHDKPDAQQTDKRGKYVLVSKRFWYFGGDAKMIPVHLSHLGKVGRGHVVHKYREKTDVHYLEAWLNDITPGRVGEPRLLKSRLAFGNR